MLRLLVCSAETTVLEAAKVVKISFICEEAIFANENEYDFAQP